MYYDLHVRSLENIEETVKLAKSLGWNGLGIIMPWKSYKEFDLEKLKANNMDMVIGAEIDAKKVSEMRRIVGSMRRRAELLVVNSNDLDMSRAALELPEVDILVSPAYDMNHVLARLAAKNNVSLCFDFRDLLHSHKKARAGVVSRITEAARIIRKYRAPFIISSGAQSPWDLRPTQELTAFGKVLGFQENQILNALSGKIIKENRKRLSGKWVMPGVEIE